MTTSVICKSLTFGETHFGKADLGDRRRTRRLVHSANRIARYPGGTLPKNFESPRTCAPSTTCASRRRSHITAFCNHMFGERSRKSIGLTERS